MSKPTDLSDKLNIYYRMRDRKLEANETRFLVSNEWVRLFEHEASIAPAHAVPPVDNSRLLTLTGELLPDLLEYVHMDCVPSELWQLLEEWFGPADFPVPRKGIQRAKKLISLELYPLRLRCYELSKSTGPADTPVFVSVYPSTAAEAFTREISRAFSGFDVPYRVWLLGTDHRPDGGEFPACRLDTALDELWPCSRHTEKTLYDLSISPSDSFIIEKQIDGRWLVDVAYPRLGKEGSDTASSSRPQIHPGTIGLGNLGHTCFMNSGLQCLAHIPQLVKYLTDDAFGTEVNRTNPLGSGGALAEAFASLVRQMSSSSNLNYFIYPRNFHRTLQEHSPHFVSYTEHDSQELVTFLLDGLHEDLNRVVNKPYTEQPHWAGESDKQLLKYAQNCWATYKARNDSIVVDLFQGQQKSSILCPECEKLSITFDPYMFLTLPLPAQEEREMAVFFVPWDGAEPSRGYVVIRSNESCQDVKKRLANVLSVQLQALFLGLATEKRFTRFLRDTDRMKDISRRESIFCFELPPNVCDETVASTGDQPIVLAVYTEVFQQDKRLSAPIGFPFIVVIRSAEIQTKQTLSAAVLNRLTHWTAQNQRSDSADFTNLFELQPISNAQQGCSFSKEDAWTSKGNDACIKEPLRNGDGLLCLVTPRQRENLFGKEDVLDPVTWKCWTPTENLKCLNSKTEPKPITLSDCLDQFSNPETLGVEDGWFCSNCDKFQRATKQLEIWTTPDVLILQLARFGGSLGGGFDKIDLHVDFPVTGLDLSARVQGSKVFRQLRATGSGLKYAGIDNQTDAFVYDLAAVAVHSGQELSTGAYRAYARNHTNNEWYYFFDKRVKAVNSSEAVISDAYLLFYERRSVKPQ